MKKEDTVRRAIGGIDDDLIEGSEKTAVKKTAGMSWVRWGTIAAAFVLVAAFSVFVLPGMLKNNGPVIPDTPTAPSGNGTGDGGSEFAFEKAYNYSVDEGRYVSYVRGTAIADKYVGDKLDDVTVTAGWVDANEKKLTEEHAKAEIYEISGVSTDVAVAIRFIDQLEAQTTTMFYVIMNPTADLTPVQTYIIEDSPWEQNDGGGMSE
ncbi:MAG: hypothetical protein IKS28_03680 [Clostridia bacterium]|nr:hypothetical protein [Clostridia bacterium]